MKNEVKKKKADERREKERRLFNDLLDKAADDAEKLRTRELAEFEKEWQNAGKSDSLEDPMNDDQKPRFERLNLSLDPDVVALIKIKAAVARMSASQLIEGLVLETLPEGTSLEDYLAAIK